MIGITRTEYYKNLKERCRGDLGIVERLCEAENVASFRILCDLAGFDTSIPSDVFMFVFMKRLAQVDPSGKIDEERCARLSRFLDVVYALATETPLINHVIVSNAFINNCGRWMAKGYSRKDKRIFLKLAKLLALVATRIGT